MEEIERMICGVLAQDRHGILRPTGIIFEPIYSQHVVQVTVRCDDRIGGSEWHHRFMAELFTQHFWDDLVLHHGRYSMELSDSDVANLWYRARRRLQERREEQAFRHIIAGAHAHNVPRAVIEQAYYSYGQRRDHRARREERFIAPAFAYPGMDLRAFGGVIGFDPASGPDLTAYTSSYTVATEVREEAYRRHLLRAAELMRFSAMVDGAVLRTLNFPDVDRLAADLFENAYSYRAAAGESEAEKRGIQLLKEHLSPCQLLQFQQDGYFDVTGGKSGTTYRIYHGQMQNIAVLNQDGHRKHGLCFYAQEPRLSRWSTPRPLVAGDCMLAQKITLELNEDEALAIGNRF